MKCPQAVEVKCKGIERQNMKYKVMGRTEYKTCILDYTEGESSW